MWFQARMIKSGGDFWNILATELTLYHEDSNV